VDPRSKSSRFGKFFRQSAICLMAPIFTTHTLSTTYGFLVAKVVWNLGLFTRSFPRISGPRARISVHGGFFVGNPEAQLPNFLRGLVNHSPPTAATSSCPDHLCVSYWMGTLKRQSLVVLVAAERSSPPAFSCWSYHAACLWSDSDGNGMKSPPRMGRPIPKPPAASFLGAT
jgi:hypothetical protein